LQAGKAVLCEKPFTINAAEAEAVIQLARRKKLFLMEAMWTRFIPLVGKVRQLLADRVIGDLQILVADLGFWADFDPLRHVFNPQLGGGALLDLGVYSISLASMIFGPPIRITSMAQLGETGVDEQAAIILGHDQGQLALLYTSLRTDTPAEVILIGTRGRTLTIMKTMDQIRAQWGLKYPME
jgi:predicted dehydrogenase